MIFTENGVGNNKTLEIKFENTDEMDERMVAYRGFEFIKAIYLCETACELTDLGKKIINDDCGCKDDSLKDYFRRGFNEYKIIQWSGLWAREDKANESITNLQSFLDGVDCDCI